MNSNFPVYGNFTFNLNITVTPSTGTASQMHPHADVSRLAFPPSADDLNYLMLAGQRGLFNSMQGANVAHVVAQQLGIAISGNDYSDTMPAATQADSMWTGSFGEYPVPDHYATDVSTDPQSAEHYDFRSADASSMPDTPRWISTAPNLFSPAPQSCGSTATYDNAPLAPEIKQEDQYNNLFSTSQDFSTVPETPSLSSLGLFSNESPGHDIFASPPNPTSTERSEETFPASSPTVAEMLEPTWLTGDSYHRDFGYSQHGASSTPTSYVSNSLDNNSYESSAGSDWNSSVDSTPPTPHDGLLNQTHWDSSWPLTPLDDGASKTSSLNTGLVDDWEAYDRLIFGPPVVTDLSRNDSAH